MKRNLWRSGWCALACFAAMAIGQFAAAQESALTKRVDINLKDADLLTATQTLTRMTGLQFIIAPTDKEFTRINLALTGVTAEEAIRYLCQAANAYAERDENGVFIIRHGAAPATSGGGVKVPTPKVVRKVKLMRADPQVVFEMLTKVAVNDPDQGLQLINRFSMNPTNSTQVLNGANLTVVGQGVYTPSQPINNMNPRQAPSSEAGNGVLLPGESAGQGQPGGGGLGGGGLGGGGLGGGQGGQNQANLTPGEGLVPDGIDYIGYDPTDNSLVVKGTDEAIRQLQQNIALFDVAPQQVSVKVEFITTSSSITKALGFDWLYQRGGVFTGNRPGSFARAGDPIFLNYATGNVTARLRAVLDSGKGITVSAPLLRTLNNQTAIVQQTIETTIFINQVINGPGGITTVPQPIQYQVNTQLIVRPRINGDGTVTMFLTPQIQDFGQLRRGPDGSEIPDRLSSLLAVVARVKSGETIALAGLTRKSDQGSESRFPILGDLPVIGQFFRANNRQKGQQELIVFVTPVIIEDEDLGGIGP